jgi:hypothetical protein
LVRIEFHSRGGIRFRQFRRKQLRPLLENRLRVLRDLSSDFGLLARGRRVGAAEGTEQSRE